MPRILLLLPTATYRAPDFVAAAGRLGVEVVVGSEQPPALASAMGDRAVVVPLDAPEAAVEAIAAVHARAPFDAVVAVDDQGVAVAALAAERLGLRGNPSAAVAATRDKSVMRRKLAAASVPQPEFRLVPATGDAGAAGAEVGFPCVVKPLARSGSQGVIRADDAGAAREAARRIASIAGGRPEPLLVERFVPGAEVAVEGLLDAGRLELLAVFDKPDPMDGPYFEETVYVTPSRQPPAALAQLHAVTAGAAAALGLREGPLHAEARIGTDGTVTLLEVAARSIGGLCSRSLRFGAGVSLEEVIVRHAVGLGTGDLVREERASGVMMLPIRAEGILVGVTGQDEALATDGVVGLEISIAPGRPLVPLPEGDRYLGFLFARGDTPEQVDESLRRAEACLTVTVRPQGW